MLKEIRKIKSRAKANYIRQMGHRGKIKTYVNELGFVCYDPDELKAYQKSAHRGRPAKAREEKADE